MLLTYVALMLKITPLAFGELGLFSYLLFNYYSIPFYSIRFPLTHLTFGIIPVLFVVVTAPRLFFRKMDKVWL